MKSFELLSHTADVRIKVRGESLEELIISAVYALARMFKKDVGRSKSKSVSETFEVTSSDTNALLVDFLSEVLAKSEINKVVYPDVVFLELKGATLRAELAGFSVRKFDTDIKAITHHGVEILQNESGEYKAVLVPFPRD